MYVSWNSIPSHQREKVEIAQLRGTRLTHELPLEIELFENDKDNNFGVRRGHFYRCMAFCNFFNAYSVFVKPLQLKKG